MGEFDQVSGELDMIAGALEMLELVARVHAHRDLTVVIVLHDLAQAARYAHRLVVVHQGQSPPMARLPRW